MLGGTGGQGKPQTVAKPQVPGKPQKQKPAQPPPQEEMDQESLTKGAALIQQGAVKDAAAKKGDAVSIAPAIALYREGIGLLEKVIATAGPEMQSKLSGKTITCTEVGYQSRNYAWIRGLNDRELDPQDCSSTANCVNLLAQARAYEGLIRALYPMDWFDGVYLWLWRTDPTAGGSSDDSYTPQQKPATAVMKALFT